MDRLHYLLAVFIPTVLLWAQLEAITIQTNVDTEEPSLIRSPAIDIRQDGFGWTAVFHEKEVVVAGDDQDEVLRKIRVVVGAPRGTFPGGLGLEDPGMLAEIETGLIYQCNLGQECLGVRGNLSLYLQPSATLATTNGLASLGELTEDFFPAALSEGRLFDQAPNTRDTLTSANNVFERKFRQLMGSTLYSSGRNLLACAPLWTNAQRQPRGLCFVGDRSLTNFQTLYPCNNAVASHCIAGTSAIIVEEGLGSDRLVIGGPGLAMSFVGAYNGAVFTHVIDGVDFPTFDEFVPDLPLPGDTARSLHSGFQITQGYISSNDRTQRASDIFISIPRADGRNNYTGQVIRVSTSDLAAFSSATFSDSVKGGQTAEFFGYSMATCDLTGDGYDELLVGAPMYSALDPLEAERGRLFVFFNNGGSLDPEPVLLEGNSAYGRFGFAVANVGDLDVDGLEDFVVSAPYELSSSSSSTGAVYVYYGKRTVEEFRQQTPQRIFADDIVESVSTLTQLRTFGFSLDGNVDLDLNRHADFLAGAPEEQAVIVLRTLPFVNVSVEIANVPNVNLDTNPSFEVTITASYTSASVQGLLPVRFNLTEDLTVGTLPRLFFTQGDPSTTFTIGTFRFPDQDQSVTVTVVVYAVASSSVFEPYELQLDLVDFDRIVSPVTGMQPISNLATFPRLRLLGNSSVQVIIQNPCEGFNDVGCTSDIRLSPIVPSVRTLIAGSVDSVVFDVSYSNVGPEDGLDAFLQIYNVPSRIFSGFGLLRNGRNAECSPPGNIMPDVPLTNISCNLQTRILPSATAVTMARLEFFQSSTIIGNEDPLNISMEITVNMIGLNQDQDLSNNMQTIQFKLDSRADINIERMLFSPSPLQYMAENPDLSDPSITGGRIRGGDALLQVQVGNSGPSIIQNARVVINFPSRSPVVTGDFFFLYPSTLTAVIGAAGLEAGTTVNCSLGALDPDMLEGSGDPQVNIARRRRSVPGVFATSLRVRRLAARNRAKSDEPEMGVRRKRQADFILDCDTASCDVFTCDIQRLTDQGINFRLLSNIDERFYSSAASSRVFNVRATSSVSVTSLFQIADDNTTDNTASATAQLMPVPAMEGTDNLVHYIVWPIIGGILILIVLVVLLHFLGFFRRKKKPGEEDEIEGDANIPPGAETKAAKPMTEEATTM